MSIWSRLAGRRAADDPADLSPDTLLEDPRRSATRLGADPLVMPWSARRLSAIFEDFERYPGARSLGEARLARQCLSQFWLAAPVDQLQLIYESQVGDCYRRMLSSPLAEEKLVADERAWRDTLANRLMSRFDRPETTNLLLALMPYFAPGKMQVDEPMRRIPPWLQEDYARLFDPMLMQSIGRPKALLNPAGQAYGPAPRLGQQSQEPSAPQGEPRAWSPQEPPPSAPLSAGPEQPGATIGDQPQLYAQRGPALLPLLQGEDQQRRLDGLINLFVIDPTDPMVQGELCTLRRQLGQLWLDAQPEMLEGLFASTIGRLYRDLLASGFSRTPLSPEDRLLRNRLARLVSDMSQPGALNALMAALPFYPPGKISFGGGERHIPEWFGREMLTVYGEST